MLPAQTDLDFVTLPSTSPANARLTLDEKIAAWRVVTAALRPHQSAAVPRHD
jgi:G:T/U-mismatch repair DNA glycosylase